MLQEIQVPISLKGFGHSKILNKLSESAIYEVIRKAENLRITYWYQTDWIIGKVLKIDESNIASCGFTVEGMDIVNKISKAKKVTLAPSFLCNTDGDNNPVDLKCVELTICPY